MMKKIILNPLAELNQPSPDRPRCALHIKVQWSVRF